MFHFYADDSLMRLSRKAFTLIDLAILLLLIAVVAGVLLPALARRREEARRGSCHNRLRQLGTGMIQYIDQFGKGRYYTWPGPQKASFTGAQWIASMYWTSLLNEPELYICPSTSDENASGGELGRRFTSLAPRHVSYASRNGMMGVIIDKMRSNTMMMTDDTEGRRNHSDGITLLYFDAHVEWGETVSPLAEGEPGKATLGRDRPVDMLRN